MEIYGKSYCIQLNFDKILIHFWKKFLASCFRLVDIFRKFPLRLGRFFKHLFEGAFFIHPDNLNKERFEIDSRILSRISVWWLELFIYFLDIFGFPEFYESIMDFVKFNSRSLYHWEIELAKDVFGNSINFKRVRIDELSFSGPKQKNFCYVSFYIINSWGTMTNSTLLHELTHVWQFEQLGSVYIPRALKAQYSKMGYDYGGVSALKAYRGKEKSFLSFNLEQQGDIISDYFLIKEGYRPKWGSGCREDLPIYESYINQVKDSLRY